MPIRTWLYAVALGVALSTLLQAQEQADSPQRGANIEQDPPNDLPLGFPIRIIEDDETSNTREGKEREREQREKDDLVAQQGMNTATQSMNEATESMNRASWVSVGLVGAGTFLLFWTLWLTRQTVKTTRDIGKDQTRAYVHVKAVQMKTVEVEGKKKADCIFYIENSGHTPCKRFEIRGGVDVLAQGKTIDKLPELEIQGVGWSALAGPDVLTAPRVFEMPNTDHFTKSYNIHVGGVVRYVTFFDETFETEFSFIRRMSPGNIADGNAQIVRQDKKSDSRERDKMSKTKLNLRVYEKQ